MEELQLSKAILYNLNILRHGDTCFELQNDVLVEVKDEILYFFFQFLSKFFQGIFIKSNLNAFIQVTHFVFNIIDCKEFKKKFYWPIVDKKSENSYR